MDVRKKLVDIVCDATQINGCIHSCNHPPCAMVRGIVDALIENGVTVQEWISVTERLPDKDGAYLVTTNGVSGLQNVKTRWFAKDGEMVDAYDLAGQKDVWYLYDSECGYVSIKTVTQWMPLPPEPKKEGLQ